MAWNTPSTAVAATVLTAATWNAQVRDNLLWLGTSKSWNIRRAATVSLTNAAFTAVTFDSETTDTDGFIAAPSTTVTIPTGLDGYYGISFAGTTAATFTGSPLIRFIVSGSTMANTTNIDLPTSGATGNIAASFMLPLPAAATVAVSVFQNSGAAVTLNSCTFVGKWLFRGT